MIFAYFDPGPGSLLVQALVGGAAGLIVFGKYVWNSAFGILRKSKSKNPGADVTCSSTDSSGEISQDALP